jgi:hypothetical protein
LEFVDFYFFFFFPTEEAPKSMVEDGENGASAGRGSKVQGGEGGSKMEVVDGEDGASAGRVQGGADAPAAHARPSDGASAGRVQGGADAPAAHARPSVGMATFPECQDSSLLAKQVRIVSVDVCGF